MNNKEWLDVVKLWCKCENIENIRFAMYAHDRGGVRCENMYKVFSDVRNESVCIVFTQPIYLKEGVYKVESLLKDETQA